MAPPNPDKLDGKLIAISGASHGIGRALAVACAADGATVLACGRDVAALETLADEVADSGAKPPVLLPINLERAGAEDYSTIAEHIRADYGGLDALVVNAARLGQLAPLGHHDGVDWARTFQVNVHSVFLLLQACLPLLELRKPAQLIFSLAAEGQQAKANWGAYAVSKYALRGLFELSAAEARGKDHLHVCAVIPPATATALRRVAFPATDPASLASPEQVAAVYLEILNGSRRVDHGTIVDLASAGG